MYIKRIAVIGMLASLGACQYASFHQPDEERVIEDFRVLANAMLQDSLTTAETLQQAVIRFTDNPSDISLAEAQAAYQQTRVPYQQSEILRFDEAKGHVTAGLDDDGGPASVDAWEGQVNAWPLDEALIDYVDGSSYEGEYAENVNIINSASIFTVNGEAADVSNITPELLVSLNEIGGSEANVATGVHAIEFLLWGQDLNGTNPGAGARPISDYYTNKAQGDCTSGEIVHSDYTICERRAAYLEAASQLLVDDLSEMVAEWDDAAITTQGTLAYDFLNRGDGIARIIESMGDMAVGELASERMRVAVLFGSTEDEHDCFSDNTHIAIYNNAQGVINAYRGSYTTIHGDTVSGASISDLVSAENPALNAEINAKLTAIQVKMQGIVDLAEKDGYAFDQIIGGIDEQKALVLSASDSLASLGGELEQAAELLSLNLGGIDTGTCSSSDLASCE